MKIRQSNSKWLWYVEDEEGKIVHVCWDYALAFDYVAKKLKKK